MDQVKRLAKAIGYPEEELSPAGGASSLKVDGYEVRVEESGGRLVMTCSLGSPEESALVRLAGFAAGRVLKEEATLAWEPREGELILWQGIPAASSDEALKRAFEVFTASCDWWRDRVREEDVGERVPEMMIRP